MNIATFVKHLAGQGIELYPNDGQLGVRAAEGSLTPELIAQLKTHKQALLDYFKTVETSPLSYLQRGLWFELQLSPHNTQYHISRMARIYSVVDVTLLQQAFQQLVNRHPILRTTVTEADGQPRLQVHQYQHLSFTQIDASGWSTAELKRQQQAYHEAPFDLSKQSFHVYLFTRKPDEHLLQVRLHHLLIDGLSMSVMFAELHELYLAAKSQRTHTLPPIETTYTDYVAWQQTLLAEQGEELRAYWCKQLGGPLPILNLPTDRPYQGEYNQKTEKYRFNIDASLLQSLRTLARREGVTFSTLLLAAYNILLHRYTGQDDILVGSLMAGRSRETFARVLGYFLSPIVLRATFTDDLTVQTFLKQFNQTVIGGMNHQDYPLPLLVDALKPPHIPGHHPLYQARFNMQRAQSQLSELLPPQTVAGVEEPLQDWDGLYISSFRGIQDENPLGLTLHVTDFTDRLHAVFSYDALRFDETTIKRMGDHFVTLLSSMVDDPTQPVHQLPMLTSAEYQQVVHEWNDTATPARGNFGAPAEETFHALFEQQVLRTPNAIALVFNDSSPESAQQLTYAELNGRANQLAHHLRSLGVQRETLVAVAMERSIEMVVGLLAVLKAGGAYLPIDPNYPPARIDFMLTDAGNPLVLTKAKVANKFNDKTRTFCVDSEWATVAKKLQTNPSCDVNTKDLAYCIYTSGSTGKPKGSLIEHRHLLNYLLWAVEVYRVAEGSGAPVNTSISFDATITSLFTPLLVGKKVILLAEENELDALADLLQSGQALSLVKLTPTHLTILSQLVQQKVNVQHFVIGGEALLESHLTHWRTCAPDTQLINEYGPTETVVGCCVYNAKDKLSSYAVPIGSQHDGVVANAQIYLLDAHQQPVPIGVHGEIYIGGAGVARGYLNRPEETAVRFVHNPFGSGKLYKTGDLARWVLAPDGSLNLEYLGRFDTQVKVNGFRIELGEVEAALLEHQDIREAIVLRHELDNAANAPEVVNCIRCGLPSNHPDANLNEDHICAICLAYDTYKEKAWHYFRTMDDFQRIVHEMKRRRKGDYDCMMLLSGGKDSTYVLAQLVEMGLNVLSFTLDNGFISADAKANIRKVVDALGVDHIFGETPAMNAVFVESLQKFSNVCQGCFKVIYTRSMNIARAHGINYIVTGLSKGQIFETRLQPLFKDGVFDAEKIDRQIIEARKIYHRLDDVVSRQMDVEIFQRDEIFDEIQFVDFYRYSDVTLAEMYTFLGQRVPWVRPADTGRSTNCLINDVGIYIHKKQKGYHNYALPYSWDVILGHKERDAALEELDDEIDQGHVQAIMNEIGYSEPEEKTARLVAYYMADHEFKPHELRERLLQQLPNHMIPAAFVRLDTIPLTSNGKLDHNALPAPDYAAAQTTFVAPRNALEQQLADIWGDVLGIKQVGIHDNFFALGGHSLLATQVISRVRGQLNLDLPLRTLFDASQLATFAEAISQVEANRGDTPKHTIASASATRSQFPLSFSQQRLWFLDQFEPLSAVYNIPVLIRLEGELDTVALEQSFTYLVQRHESLRTTFDMVDSEPMQVIHAPSSFSLPVIAVTDEEEAVRRGQAGATTPFNLSQGPLLRVELFRIKENDHVLAITMHHIISDAWSLGLFIKELVHAYTAYTEGKFPTLTELPIQYADYAVWQRDYLSGDRLEQQLSFWREHLLDAPAQLTLPIDRPRPPVQSFRGGRYPIKFGRQLSDQLNQLAQNNDASLFMVLLSGFNILLARYSRQNDVVVGTPIANRNHGETEGLLGFFLNTLALRTQLDDNLSFTELLGRVRQNTLAAYEHQELPFEQLVDELQLERSLSYSPLFQVMLVLQNAEVGSFALPGVTASRMPIGSAFAKFDLTLVLREGEEGLRGILEYSTDLFDEATIANMVTHLEVLFNGLVSNPEKPVLQLPLVADAEYQQIVHQWNETAVNFGEPQTIQQLFEQQVTRTPTAIALRFEDEQLTYAELNERANQLAHHLIELGVQVDTLVAVAMERSLEMVVSLLAVLKAGGAYVPIDPTYPVERIQYMLNDSAAPIVLTQSHLDLAVSGKQLIAVDQFEADESLVDNPQRFDSPDALAYVIYTSGSTGRPKGVGIEHRAAFNYLQWSLAKYGIHRGSGSILHSPLAFDLTVTSIWSPLLAGKPLTILPESNTVNVLLERVSQLSDLSFIKLTPAHLQLINYQLEPDKFAGRTNGLIIGGEALHKSVVAPWRQLAPETRLINEYGPTEATVGCVIHTVTPEDEDEWIKIGRPIANTQIYILDDYLQPVPIGVAGELYIGGAQLARGYLNRAELTAERFITHPKFGRLYKTGDLCRWLRDGMVVYIGRTDFQVKIRGFRIELGEIESTLRTLAGVDDAVVIVREDGAADKRLVAYYTGECSGETVREQLADRLPHYMIPTAFVLLDVLPLTTNGKVDRRALPSPDEQVSDQTNFTPPRSEIETVLAQAFAGVLRLPQVGIHDDFFRMGGDSISSIQLVNRIAQKGYTIRVKDVFLHPTVAQLATAVQTEQVQIRASQAVQEGYAPLSPIQRWLLDANQPQLHHYNHAFLLKVGTPIDPVLLESAIGTLLQHHDALRFQYKQDKRGWQQHYLPPMQRVPLDVIDLTDMDDGQKTPVIETACAQAQVSLNPQAGELTRWLYFKGSEMGDRLFIAIHHLAFDGVSRHILFDDLATLLDGKALPPKTSSYREWVETLQAETAQGRFDGDIAQWLADSAAVSLPLDDPDAPNTMGSSHHLRQTLSREQTTHLLRTLPERHAITFDALLLTALTETLTDWSGNDALRVKFESHGRQELFDTINLNRTVGWFTSVYPLTIPCFNGTAVKRIRYTLDTLRRVADGGVSFGALRDYHPDAGVREQFAQLPTASVVYNYLGQMDGANDAPFARAPESAGRPISADFQRDTLIDLNAAVIEGQLRISWAVSPQITYEQAVTLHDLFMQKVGRLISESLAAQEQIVIPTDFANADISITRLESVLNSVKASVLEPSVEDEEF